MKRVLFISSAWPVSGHSGGQMRAYRTALALRSVGPVSVIVVSADAVDDGMMQQSAVSFDTLEPILPALMPNRTLKEKARWGLDTRFMNVHGTRISTQDVVRLERAIEERDLVWVLNSRTPNIVQRWCWSKAHLDIDDVPSTYHRAAAKSARSARERWKALLLQHLMKRRELRWKERFTTLSVCSEEDKRYLRGGSETHVIPNGFDRPVSEPVRNLTTAPPRIGFVGLYNYEPNRDGVQWFLEQCWPKIRKEIPGVRFRIIGKGTNGEGGPKGPDVDSLGFLEDTAAEIATWSVMAIPIRLGGGTRIKVADAFSRKCPVVSTQLGAFGYGAEEGKQLRLADTPDQFASACVDLIKNPETAAEMAGRAWAEFLTKWTWDVITPKVTAAAEDCLRRTGDQAGGSLRGNGRIARNPV